MDRESDHEDLEHRDRDRNGNDNGDGSEESDIDQRSPFIQSDRRNQAIEEETMDFPAEAVGRMLKSVTGGRPIHRTTSASGICSSSTGNLISSAGFMNSNSQLTNERLFQYNYLSQQQQQQQMNSNYPQSHYPPLQLQSVAAVAALMQQSAAIAAASANSFQSVPPSELSSSQTLPCSQKQQPSPSNSYETSPSNFQSLASAHVRRSASVSSRQSGEEPTVAQNSWSFEEQFKQLYDIDRDDPERKKFLDDLFSFMQKHETPVTRLPIMAKSVLDLYELYKLVVQRGGLVDVINKKLWQEVIKGLNLPSSITSAAFTLRTQYVKFLYQYECAKLNLSNENELKAAIEGNKREGRRTSYPYGDLGHVQSPNQQHHQQHHHNSNSVVSSSNGTTMSSLHHLIGQSQPPQPHHQGSPQISPVSLVSGRPPQLNGHGHSMSSFGIASNASHVNTASSLPSSIPNAHCVPSLMLQGTTVPDVRILDYIKFFNGLPINGAGTSPELPDANSLNNMHMTQLEFWNLYNGLVKSSVQTNARDTMPTTAATSQVQSSTSGVNEAPLDLGKRRATDSLQSSNSSSSLPPPTKKEALDSDQDDENEDGEESSVSDSDSNDDDPEKNSSQDIAELTKATNPFVVRMKINGIRYKGIMRPIITNNNRSTNWNIREC